MITTKVNQMSGNGECRLLNANSATRLTGNPESVGLSSADDTLQSNLGLLANGITRDLSFVCQIKESDGFDLLTGTFDGDIFQQDPIDASHVEHAQIFGQLIRTDVESQIHVANRQGTLAAEAEHLWGGHREIREHIKLQRGPVTLRCPNNQIGSNQTNRGLCGEIVRVAVVTQQNDVSGSGFGDCGTECAIGLHLTIGPLQLERTIRGLWRYPSTSGRW
jgi:hypothetical protein